MNTVENTGRKTGDSESASPGRTVANTKKVRPLNQPDLSRVAPLDQTGIKITRVAVLMAPRGQSDASGLALSKQPPASQVLFSSY